MNRVCRSSVALAWTGEVLFGVSAVVVCLAQIPTGLPTAVLRICTRGGVVLVMGAALCGNPAAADSARLHL